MKRPTVGDIVRYVSGGYCFPAMVISLGQKLDCENKDGTIDCLRVFTDKDNGQSLFKNVKYVKPFVHKWKFFGFGFGRLKFTKDSYKEGTWHYAEDWKNGIYGRVKRHGK